MRVSALPPPPNFFNRRLELRRKAIAALEQRLVDSGAPTKGGGRVVEDVLVAGVSEAAEQAALADLTGHGGGVLQPSKDGTIPFCSAESSAAIAVNSFAVFADRPFADPLLGLTLGPPQFEQRYKITGFKSSAAPVLEVVFRDEDRALLIDSKLMEPWHKHEQEEIGPQYDAPAAAVSPGALAMLEALRCGELTYLALDAPQLLKALLAVHGAIARDKLPAACAIVALRWSPSDPGLLGDLFELLGSELADFAARVADQPVAVRGLSYGELWASWASESAPGWLQEHARRLQDRYAISLKDR